MPSRTASRAGSESGFAAGRCGPGSAAARHWQPRPEPLAGGTGTLQEILDTDRVPSDVVESDQLSQPGIMKIMIGTARLKISLIQVSYNIDLYFQ